MNLHDRSLTNELGGGGVGLEFPALTWQMKPGMPLGLNDNDTEWLYRIMICERDWQTEPWGMMGETFTVTYRREHYM